jgi:hypothetical protein
MKRVEKYINMPIVQTITIGAVREVVVAKEKIKVAFNKDIRHRDVRSTSPLSPTTANMTQLITVQTKRGMIRILDSFITSPLCIWTETA